MSAQQTQEGPPRKVGRNTTTRRGTGNVNRRVVNAGGGGPDVADPPKPAGIESRSLANDPAHGAEFACNFHVGTCVMTPSGLQCALSVDSPPGWFRNNIRNISFPEYAGFTNVRLQGPTGVSLHKRVVPQFSAFFKTARVKGLSRLFLSNGGGYNARTVTGSRTNPSNHAYGTAIDINAAYNRIRHTPALRGTTGSVRELADFCADFGIFWGGWYANRKDGMHFECVALQTEPVLRAACHKNGFELEDLNLPAEYFPLPTR